jgi:hypothetical protein
MVTGLRWGLDTRLGWPNDRRLQDNLDFELVGYKWVELAGELMGCWGAVDVSCCCENLVAET